MKSATRDLGPMRRRLCRRCREPVPGNESLIDHPQRAAVEAEGDANVGDFHAC